ncbi:DUF5347 family protein [Proteus mirabilis]|uniref:DUF5347 family protein n=1 Tax=Proteus mirabilis TaxID=584 RepID=UPI001073C411|nr:DUF5347 family protein [Proteus mirabilis]TFT82362.1 hypothetical protein E4V48_04495 [Proteus mirabilis]
MYQNPVERENRAFEMPLKLRIKGLNSTAKLRAEHFNSDNKELSRFFDDMKNKHDEMYEKKRIFLAYILKKAGIKKERMNLDVDKFSNDELNSIIEEINELLSLCSLLPKRLSLVK